MKLFRRGRQESESAGRGEDPEKVALLRIAQQQAGQLAQVDANLEFHKRMGIIRAVTIGMLFALPLLAHTDVGIASQGSFMVQAGVLALVNFGGAFLEKMGVKTNLSRHPRGMIGALGDFSKDAGLVLGLEMLQTFDDPARVLSVFVIGAWLSDMHSDVTRST